MIKVPKLSPVRIELLLKNHLDDLTEEKLREFQWLLAQNKKEGCPSIPRSELENANRMNTVDKMVASYGLDGALETTVKILKKMNDFELAERLTEAKEGLGVTVSLNVRETQLDDGSIPLDLFCLVCSFIFTEPVMLPCGHSFCRTCVHNRWKGKIGRKCPFCIQVLKTDAEPPVNLALKSLSEKYKERIPLDPSGGRRIESDETSSRTIREKREAFEKVKKFCDSSIEHIKSQRKDTEQKIKDDFEKFHLFLETEEANRIAALEEEEAQKIRMMQKITEISSDTFSLSDTVKDLEDLGADSSFIQNFRTEIEKAQNALPDPQLLPQVLINESKHVENLHFSVLEKMLSIVKHNDEAALMQMVENKEGNEQEKQMGKGEREEKRRPFLVEEDMEQSKERPSKNKKEAKSSYDSDIVQKIQGPSEGPFQMVSLTLKPTSQRNWRNSLPHIDDFDIRPWTTDEKQPLG